MPYIRHMRLTSFKRPIELVNMWWLASRSKYCFQEIYTNNIQSDLNNVSVEVG